MEISSSKLKIVMLFGITLFVVYQIYNYDNKIAEFSQKIAYKSAETLLREDSEKINTLLFMKQKSCQPLYPKAVIYNRIPKTGSESLIENIISSQNQMNFTTIQYIGEREWYSKHSGNYTDIIIGLTQKYERFVFAAHHYFREHLPINVRHTYINTMREPLNRMISEYYYVRSTKYMPDNVIKEKKRLGRWNDTLIQCIERQYPGCEDNRMTRFFCGTSQFCKTGSKWALDTAKYNLHYRYAVVGTLEQFNTTLKVLRQRLPTFFGSKTFQLLHQVNVNHAPKKKQYSDDVYELIKMRNKADYKLYEYAMEELEKQADDCKD